MQKVLEPYIVYFFLGKIINVTYVFERFDRGVSLNNGENQRNFVSIKFELIVYVYVIC